MTLTTRVLLGLVAGTLLGLALAGSQAPLAVSTLAVLSAVGGVFVDLIRMTAMPLVASLVVASIGAATAGGLGRAGRRATVMAAAMLAVATLGTILVAQPVLQSVSPDPAAITSAASTASPASLAAPTGLAQWVRELVPPNVAKAAADGAMLPLIVFAVLFGLALARVSPGRRDAVLGLVEGVASASVLRGS